MSSSSSFLPKSSDLHLRERKKNFDVDELELATDEPFNEEKDTKSANLSKAQTLRKKIGQFGDKLAPTLLTLLAFYVRFSGIGKNPGVVWDEAHFGKFGSYYIKNEFYHDVHPPLGKMLIGLSEYLAGFNGDFDFSSGATYPDHCNFVFMRRFNAVFGALCTPVVYFTARNMGFSLLTTYLLTLMVTLELTYVTLSKFILLDSMLLFFTAVTFYCVTKLHTLRTQQFTREWSLWMLLSGLSVGCVCSVKWVGLFITLVMGIYTIADLFSHHCNKSMPRIQYYRHWVIRIIDLIIIPFMVYLFCFKIHFAILHKSGTGDASTNTLFQVNLDGTNIEMGPRDVHYGSHVTIRSHGLSPNLLHSHAQSYPVGSGQRQITGYGHSDDNNIWVVQFSRGSGLEVDDQGLLNNESFPLTDFSEIRLVHKNTESNLHSHDIPSHVSKGNFEVSGYGDKIIGDSKDDWIVEIVEQLDSANKSYHEEDPNLVHPISTSFRLRHKELGCYLATTGLAYPSWGFKQAEIVCKNSWSKRDKSTWWNIEDHWNTNLDLDEGYVPPKSKFWADFILTNFAMASSNNALVPDEDKYDNLASEAWEWPTLHVGLRMCGWSNFTVRYFLLGSPFNTWLSSLSLIIFIFIISVKAYKWKRQTLNLSEDDFWTIFIQGILPMISWVFHYVPFVLMGRVTYVHHYVPALYFAILVFGFVLESLFSKRAAYVRYPAYMFLFGGCIYVYILFAPIAQGMTGTGADYKYLVWLPSWKIV
ncbi:LAFE_0A07382g1_1 [Lachancea fermentati]|uniref:Dolichyl-phosphate-mannose--protein mannosyltransferase n=1 Tax=Lachancea fermentati TaxID=4955 RepID=A0A1G4M7F8_LACFM|nr:LAFE_0A07382g1_1 [Lachancea fermentati]